jgi:hypothetical protein
MTALQWIGLLMAGAALLFVLAAIGVVRICLEVEETTEESGEAPQQRPSPWRLLRQHSRSP